MVNNVAPKDRDIAMVFQNYALYPHMNVLDNMAFALKLRRMPKDQITDDAWRRGRLHRHQATSWPASRGSSPAARGSVWRWGAQSCASRKSS